MSEKTTPPSKKISPAKEREKMNEKTVTAIEDSEVIKVTRRGVSAPQAVFLSFLTTLMLGLGIFAFREQILPYAQHFLGTENPVEKPLSTSLPAGFVPIPVQTAFPTIEAAVAPSATVATADSNQLQEFNEKQNALAEEIGAIRAQLALVSTAETPSNAAASTPQIAQQLASTESSLSSALAKIDLLEGKLAEIGVTTASLADQMGKVTPQNDMRGLISFQTLQSQALSGQPFQAPLQRVIALLPDSSQLQVELDFLEKIAPKGRTLLPVLRQSFQTAVSGYMQTGNTADDSFMAKVKSNLSSFVRVRRTDSDAPADDAIINAAEKSLASGNVKGAYAELLKLDSDARAPFKEWLSQARTYYQLPEYLQAVQLQLSTALEAGN